MSPEFNARRVKFCIATVDSGDCRVGAGGGYMIRKSAMCIVVLLVFLAPAALHADSQVYFNASNGKVHKMSCTWGQRCTRNCIVIPRSEAYKRGGVPCKVCGG